MACILLPVANFRFECVCGKVEWGGMVCCLHFFWDVYAFNFKLSLRRVNTLFHFFFFLNFRFLCFSLCFYFFSIF